MSQHPRSPYLARALARCSSLSIEWSGTVFRSASPRYANRDDLITGLGSKIVGGRWNPPNSFATVYSSLEPHTALEEVLAHFRTFQLSPAKALPRVIVGLKVRLQKVLDLTQALVRRKLKVTFAQLLRPIGGNAGKAIENPFRKLWVGWPGIRYGKDCSFPQRFKKEGPI